MSETTVRQPRDLNFELLRVLSILSIVMGHLGTMNPGLPNPLTLLGDVNCFILISGYFVIKGRFKALRFVRLAVETIFYCFAISLIFYFVNPSIGSGILLKSAFPFAPHTHSYWFINKFLALIALQPFLSKIANAITRQQLKTLIIILLLLNSKLCLGFPFSDLFDNGWSLPWFITLFFIGGYIRLYDPFSTIKHWGWLWVLSVVIFLLAGNFASSIFDIQYNQWFFIAKSLTMFMFIRSIKVSPNSLTGKITQFIAPNVLAVYLIHNQHNMIEWLCSVGSQLTANQAPGMQMVYWITFTIVVIIACVVIDKIRVAIFRKCGISKAMDKLSQYLDLKCAF